VERAAQGPLGGPPARGARRGGRAAHPPLARPLLAGTRRGAAGPSRMRGARGGTGQGFPFPCPVPRRPFGIRPTFAPRAPPLFLTFPSPIPSAFSSLPLPPSLPSSLPPSLPPLPLPLPGHAPGSGAGTRALAPPAAAAERQGMGTRCWRRRRRRWGPRRPPGAVGAGAAPGAHRRQPGAPQRRLQGAGRARVGGRAALGAGPGLGGCGGRGPWPRPAGAGGAGRAAGCGRLLASAGPTGPASQAPVWPPHLWRERRGAAGATPRTAPRRGAGPRRRPGRGAERAHAWRGAGGAAGGAGSGVCGAEAQRGGTQSVGGARRNPGSWLCCMDGRATVGMDWLCGLHKAHRVPRSG
jgi:hypothetical protein